MLARNWCVKLGLMMLMLWWTPTPKALAETPREQLQRTIDRVIEVLRTIRSVEEIERNKGLLREILLTRFDFTEMARRSLGSHWDHLDGKEEEFVLAFTQFIEG